MTKQKQEAIGKTVLEQMAADLADREATIQVGAQAGGVIDKWRVHQYTIDCTTQMSIAVTTRL